MISFALILMTLPSRMAEVRAERKFRDQHGLSPQVADSSLFERCNGVYLKRRSSKTQALGTNASTIRNDSSDNHGDLNLWRR